MANEGAEKGPITGRPRTGEEALQAIRERELRWVELFYTDLFGGFNHIHLPSHTLDADSFVSGIPKLDGSSVRGFREIYESDMILKPDPTTFGVIPWNAPYGGSARFICDILVGASVLDTYHELKREEQLQLNLRPHPYEFYRYLDV